MDQNGTARRIEITELYRTAWHVVKTATKTTVYLTLLSLKVI